MKKYNRQRVILDIIEKNDIRTQEELSEALKLAGISATQATISRDIKELRISKVQTNNDEYKYTVIDSVHDSLNERLLKIFRSAVLSVTNNESFVIVQTVAYAAPVVGLAISNAKIDNIAGVVTGHDTIFVTLYDQSKVEEVVNKIKEFM